MASNKAPSKKAREWVYLAAVYFFILVVSALQVLILQRTRKVLVPLVELQDRVEKDKVCKAFPNLRGLHWILVVMEIADLVFVAVLISSIIRIRLENSHWVLRQYLANKSQVDAKLFKRRVSMFNVDSLILE
jgi:hypothetical protein